MENRKHLMWLAIAVSAALAIGCGRQESTNAAATVQPVPIRTAALRVQMHPFAPSIAITGTLVSRSAVTVKAETTGRIVRFPKEEGDAVEAGEIVVWVDDSHEKVAAMQAQSGVVVAEAALERAKVSQRHAQSEWVRAQNLLKSGGITDRDFKAAELADRDATAQMSVCAAQVEQARSQLAATKQMLEDSVVRAPVAGEIQAKLAAQGGYVEPPTALFLLVDNTMLELESLIATIHLGRIRPGQQARFKVNSFPAEEFIAKVIEVNPAVQAETRSAKVRLRVDNRSGKLKAGMFAQGEIITGNVRSSVLLPSNAVYRDDRSIASAYVFVIDNGRATKRTVVIGSERDTLFEVVTGLTAGEIVAAEQSVELAEGVLVSPDIREGK